MQADISAYLRSAARSRRVLSVIGAGADTYTAPTADEERDWRDSASCGTVDPELYFPEKGGSAVEAKKVCRSCFVRTECLQYALDNNEDEGIWGGLTQKELRKLKRSTATEVAA